MIIFAPAEQSLLNCNIIYALELLTNSAFIIEYADFHFMVTFEMSPNEMGQKFVKIDGFCYLLLMHHHQN